MTREEAISLIKSAQLMLINPTTNEPVSDLYAALDMAIQALSQEPCQLLIIKSDIFLHQDDRKKWMDSIKREKENGVIILPPYFTPLLVPNDVEIRSEQPCDDAISRILKRMWNWRGKHTTSIDKVAMEQIIRDELPSVTQKSGMWKVVSDGYGDSAYICECSECKDTVWVYKDADRKWNYCSNCGARMESEVEE